MKIYMVAVNGENNNKNILKFICFLCQRRFHLVDSHQPPTTRSFACSTCSLRFWTSYSLCVYICTYIVVSSLDNLVLLSFYP